MAPKRASSAGGSKDEDRVRVVVRIRPPMRKDEKFGDGSESLQCDQASNLLFLLAKEEADGKRPDPKQYCFDRILWKDSTQRDAWEHAGMPVVNSVLEGYTGCVMCYGQTGAGKSFTLANEAEGQEGIMIQAFNHIFKVASESRDLKYEVAISYQQIYLDSITDLLNPSGSVDIREDPKSGVYVEGAKWDTVTTAKEALKTLQKGNSNRAVACTKMNAGSSRSHAALIVRITTTGGVRTLNGMLYLVDLAGSERIKKSGVEGAALDEAKAINQSLTTLGRCIEVLASGKKEKPPFRESKLTRLLSNAIGGGAKTTLVVCCAPTMLDQSETVGSLDFGQQAMNVVVRAKVNASTDFGSLTASLMSQKNKKEKPIRELEMKVLRELRPKLDEVVQLEMECKQAVLELEMREDKTDGAASQIKELERVGKEAEEADKAKLVELLNEKAIAAQELEQALLSLSSDPEVKRMQEAHEEEKAVMIQKSMELQEQLRTAEAAERANANSTGDAIEGVCETARNLGQIAAFMMQTGQTEEAGDFYLQAKNIFEGLLGADHPKTVAWQEDLFFLINAPAIQRLVKEAKTSKDISKPEETEDSEATWWTHLFEMGDEATSDEDNWWLSDVFSTMETGGKYPLPHPAEKDEIFGTPRGDGISTQRSTGPVFTPRGTLVALQQANGNTGAAMALGKPLQKQLGIPEDEQVDDATVNMEYAKAWIEKVFDTPRMRGGSDDISQEKTDAFKWLKANFGVGAGKQDAENMAPINVN